MSQNQSVTIGITCFNARDTIGRAIASALAQDWPEIEVLIVDDASIDDSAAVVEAAIVAEPRARLIRLAANGGPSVARNALLAGARGDFIVFFDDDDESLPQRVRRQIEAIEEFEAQHGGLPVACYAGGSVFILMVIASSCRRLARETFVHMGRPWPIGCCFIIPSRAGTMARGRGQAC
ncbi:glycosyltransferase family 2 protein [Devosia aurantiaca]|uniref:Glycosyltransferase n=1 Tax=Devosia aurantiaca TaxID=2714858 RepID=A0A6M1SN52_9HYPH|nr:glycosyltransferase family 2 protein [Devosia aurantiaca]NGP18550.1 glycosyltransferase [Devosia aurantiaca]